MYPDNQNKVLNSRFANYCLMITLILLITVIILSQLLYTQPSQKSFTDHPVQLFKKSSQPKDVYIIFLNGLGCKYQDSIYADMGFPKIRRNLAKVGFTYADKHFLMYSYSGGKVVNGQWCPQKYTARDTGQSLFLSVRRLEGLIKQFSRAHPDAKYILVGHSLGGRIAMDFVSTTSPENRQKIKGIITLNSPLLGASINIPEVFVRVFNYSNGFLASPAVKQLLWEGKHWPEIAEQRRKSISELRQEGLHVATFSTQRDLVVKPLTGCITDKKGNLLTEGFIVDVNIKKISIREIFGHMGILEHPEITRYLVSLCLD